MNTVHTYSIHLSTFQLPFIHIYIIYIHTYIHLGCGDTPAGRVEVSRANGLPEAQVRYLPAGLPQLCYRRRGAQDEGSHTMYVCMYVCMYACIYVCKYVCIYLCYV